MTSATERARLAAHARLMAAIADELEAGGRVPCIGRGDIWQSEDADEQMAAVFGCTTCPVARACETYVTAHPEPVGIWAGMTQKQQNREHRRLEK